MNERLHKSSERKETRVASKQEITEKLAELRAARRNKTKETVVLTEEQRNAALRAMETIKKAKALKDAGIEEHNLDTDTVGDSIWTQKGAETIDLSNVELDLTDNNETPIITEKKEDSSPIRVETAYGGHHGRAIETSSKSTQEISSRDNYDTMSLAEKIVESAIQKGKSLEILMMGIENDMENIEYEIDSLEESNEYGSAMITAAYEKRDLLARQKEIIEIKLAKEKAKKITGAA